MDHKTITADSLRLLSDVDFEKVRNDLLTENDAVRAVLKLAVEEQKRRHAQRCAEERMRGMSDAEKAAYQAGVAAAMEQLAKEDAARLAARAEKEAIEAEARAVLKAAKDRARAAREAVANR